MHVNAITKLGASMNEDRGLIKKDLDSLHEVINLKLMANPKKKGMNMANFLFSELEKGNKRVL